ncbi:RNA polymerase sigma-70 factor [Olivibacter sitiensis]|uniref:RNA polymerase sigma-70 factor n=1 Tax=Olivibacter sitiensis TaxID=376470 RepID=UPI00041E0053|nr:RNA polymerase sigma-70 factor [Olivibacter sitiensis]
MELLKERILSDTQIIDALANGNDAVFENLFKLHFGNLHAYACSLLKDKEAAEEIVQGVFLKIWEKRNSLKIHSSIRSYLYSMVHNDCLSQLRHQQVRQKHQMHVVHSSDNHSEPASSRIQLSELQSNLQEAINKLPEKCRIIFEMSRFEELKYQEIADILGLSIKTVENQMGKALRTLRVALADYLPLLVYLIFKLFSR